MPTIDLSGYNLADLKELSENVETEIASRQKQELKSARERILAIAQEAGVSLEQLLASPVEKVRANKGRKVQVQYRNPSDASQTWTGRGRQPKWLAERLAGGNNLSDFRIQASS